MFSLNVDIKARQRASVKWILSKAYNNRVPENQREPFYRDHEGQDHLKPQVSLPISMRNIRIPMNFTITLLVTDNWILSDRSWLGECINLLPNVVQFIFGSQLPKLESLVNITDIDAQRSPRCGKSRYAANRDCSHSNQSITNCKYWN